MQKLILLFSLFLSSIAAAQVGTKTDTATQKKTPPRDGFYDNTITKDRHNLKPTTPHERDVSFSKIVWREIPFDQLINKIFIADKVLFADIIFNAIQNDKIICYDGDDFKTILPKEKALRTVVDICFFGIFDDDENTDWVEEEAKLREQLERIPPEEITKIRIKEGWYFDEKTAKMEARILGLGFVRTRKLDNGEIIAIIPIFWLYYPDVRDFLARQAVPNQANTSWADVFDKRMFDSHITKESNVNNYRINAIKTQAEALLEAEKLKQQMQNREADRFED